MRETAEEFIKRKKQEFERELKDPKKLIKFKHMESTKKNKLYVKFKREAWTFLKQHNLEWKVFSVERLRCIDIDKRIKDNGKTRIGDIEYRFGYWVISNKRKKWWWGQFCPLIHIKDWEKLISKAKKEGTLIP